MSGDAQSRDGPSPLDAIAWRDGALALLDQRLLPGESVTRRYTDCTGVAGAIRDMVVRGAPAIGVTAAYGVVLAARQRYAQSPAGWRERIEADLDRLAASRPTAVNLGWALDRMRHAIGTVAADTDPEPALLEAARAMHAEDVAANRRMGELGAALIESRCEVLTHCNAGALATARLRHRAGGHPRRPCGRAGSRTSSPARRGRGSRERGSRRTSWSRPASR